MIGFIYRLLVKDKKRQNEMKNAGFAYYAV